MSSILATFFKQPADVQDFDIIYTDWLGALSDSGLSATATCDAGLTIMATTLLNGVVKVWTSGGTHGQKYKITTTLTTVGGRVKQAEVIVRVKEV